MNAIFRCQSSNGTHFKRRTIKDRCRPTCDNEHNWLWWYGLAEVLGIPFVQEVIACTRTVETIIPETDVAIELGGEDAKITFFDGALEQRMNGSCAGGTGAFIDQMAVLLKTDANGVNELAKNYQTIYPIASRCGVFAKTDVQPLINEEQRKKISRRVFFKR